MHMRVVRTAAKTFPTYHWADGAWIAGWPDKVVPYRLPELLAAPADAITLICEGEKDCDTAARYGFIATTNPGGAEKWQPELTQYFKGKQRVVIVQDNDEPGAKHTAAITRALKGIVPLIGVVRFPELSPGGDLSDYFDAGGTKPYLQKRIDEALKAGAAPSYALVSLDAVPLQAQHWLWRGHYPIGALEMVAGEVGLGKGLLSCDMISRATRGAEWPDGSAQHRGRRPRHRPDRRGSARGLPTPVRRVGRRPEQGQVSRRRHCRGPPRAVHAGAGPERARRRLPAAR